MTNSIDVYVGSRLRRRRRLLGLTQANLGEQVGIRFQQIQKYECAANRISASRLFDLSEALHVPVQYFYDGLSDKDAAKKVYAGMQACSPRTSPTRSKAGRCTTCSSARSSPISLTAINRACPAAGSRA